MKKIESKLILPTLQSPENLDSGMRFIGSIEGEKIYWTGENFLVDDGSGTMEEGDQYFIGQHLYLAVKERFDWTHEEAAAALGITRRTAEGLAQARVSKKLCRQLVTLALAVVSSPA